MHAFQLFVLLQQFIEITFFVSTNRINLLNLKESSDRLVITAKWFLKLSNLHMLIKQKSQSLSRNLGLGNSVKLLIVFSTKVSLPYLPYSTAQRCCFLHLIRSFIINYLLTIKMTTKSSTRDVVII